MPVSACWVSFCNAGLHSAIFAGIIRGVSSIRRKSAKSNGKAKHCLQYAVLAVLPEFPAFNVPNWAYMEGVCWLREHGFRIYGVVIVGLRGLAEALKTYPVQHCQFHRMMTARHYLTRNPDIEASQELLFLAGSMTIGETEVRSAYLSLKRNMKRLWTFYDYRTESYRIQITDLRLYSLTSSQRQESTADSPESIG